ncbi:MAG: hypothetical protein ACE5HU_03070 [Acidobacteriota bacterium]
MPNPFLIEEPFWRGSRVISGLIALGYIVAAFSTRDVRVIVKTVVFCFLCLALIWFPAGMAGYTGPTARWGRRITKTTPAGFVLGAGWVLFLWLTGTY